MNALPNDRRLRQSGYGQMIASPLCLLGSVILALNAVYAQRGDGWIVDLTCNVVFSGFFAFMAASLFYRGWNDLLMARGRTPLWLRQRRNDDWSTGRMRKPANWTAVMEIAGSLGVAIFSILVIEERLWRVLMVIAGLGGTVAPLYRLLRSIRSGRAAVVMGRLPVRPGETLSGRIETSLVEKPVYFEVTLSCMAREGEGEDSYERKLWQRKRIVDPWLFESCASGLAVPFRFDIPPDALPTRLASSDGTVEWRLEAYADIPGLDYHVSFDVPVVV